MSESAFDARSPGEMLRAARERQGLHIAALAAAIKVSPRKLDALEHDRWDELPDATFVRALAQTVCRSLKMDAAPVLELLPRNGAVSLEPSHGGLNAPFKERPGRDDPTLALTAVRPMVLAASLLMVAAVLVYALPDRLWRGAWLGTDDGVAVAASAPAAVASGASAAVSLAPTPVFAEAPAQAPSAAASVVVTPPAPTPPSPMASAPGAQVATPVAVAPAAPPPTPAPSALSSPQAAVPTLTTPLRVQTSGQSWIEVRDGAGRTVLSRLVQSGEALDLDGTVPLRATIGNAAATRLSWRGQPLDLQPWTRDNVARVELK